MGSVNLHGSLLPAYRGAAPIQRAIMNGDKVTGLTTFLLKPSVDTGDVLYQEKVTVHPDDTYGTLSERMSQIGSSLLLKTINNLMEKSITSVKQDNLIATQAPKVQPAERIINWNDTAVNITNKVRGLNPKPGAHTTLNGKWIKIFHTSPVNENYQLTPGTIIERTKMRLLVQTGEGGLFIQSLQKEGKKRMDIQEFLQGASIKEGDQLGT
jgi:methionyl-tRNA formyltransferase